MPAFKHVTTLWAVCALVATTIYAQPKSSSPTKTRQQVDIFATAKPGQWADIKGPYQKDNTILAVKVKFVNGTIAEGDCEVSGKIIALDPQKNEIKIARQAPLKCQKTTEFKDKTGVAITFADLKVGMMVEAEGSYQKDGGFLVAEVEEDIIKEEEEADYISVFGKIEKADAAAKTIQIMGITFVISEQTKSKLSVK